MIPVQEEKFDYKGYPCVILFMPTGYRCGYVGLPKGTTVNVNDISCHGGITYTENHLYHQDDKDKLWIGFDCGHYFDGYDITTAKRLYADNPAALRQISSLGMIGYYAVCNAVNPIRTLEYCKGECRKIVDQICGGRDGESV